jgi:serine/threonine protein kinase
MHEGSDDPPSTRPSGAAGSTGAAASRGPPSRAEPARDVPVAPSLARTSEGPAPASSDVDRAPVPAVVHEGAPRPTDDEGLDATEIAPSASLSPVNSSPSRPSARSSSVAERLERRREKDPRVGTTLSGRYRLEKAIAKGGMGRVYLATQLQLGRSVAVKILNPEFRDTDPQFVRRFSIEASICARLAHPNVVTVHDYGESETGELFMAMELLRGKTLSAAVQKEAPFAPARTIHIALQVARALREAHVLGIIHRDLKPGNIMLVEAGDDADFVKVLDFGLVKLIAPESGEAPGPAPDDVDLTRQGTLLGSPRYMSPEQIRGEVLDPRTDIYSFGIILFQMAAGRPPFTGSGSVDLIYKHIHEKPPRVSDVAHGDCPPELEDLIAQCLEKDRALRFASMADVISALKQARSSITGIIERPPTDTGPLRRAAPPAPVPIVDVGADDATRSGMLGGVLREAAFVEAPGRLAPDPSRLVTAPRPSRWTVVIGLAGVFAAALVIASWATRGGPRPSEDALIQAAPATATARTIVLEFRSDPVGARVRSGGQIQGTTPFSLELPLSEDAAPRVFEAELEGYEPASTAQRLDASRLVMLVLNRAAPASAAPAPSLPPPGLEPSPTTPPPASSSSAERGAQPVAAPTPAAAASEEPAPKRRPRRPPSTKKPRPSGP